MVSCESCKYWERDPGKDGKEDECGEFSGTCHRYPPVSVLDGEPDGLVGDEGEWLGRPCHSFVYWAQPVTTNTDWCGEYILANMQLKPMIAMPERK